MEREGRSMARPKGHMNRMHRREAVAGYLCLLPNFLDLQFLQ